MDACIHVYTGWAKSIYSTLKAYNLGSVAVRCILKCIKLKVVILATTAQKFTLVALLVIA